MPRLGKKMLSALCGLALLVSGIGLSGGVAQAHVLKQNSDISGVLHIPPYDEPAAGTTTTLYFAFAAIGSYVVEIHGHAKNGQFADFALPYKVRVTTDSRSTAPVARNQNTTAITVVCLSILAGIAVFGVAGARDSGRYRQAEPVKIAKVVPTTNGKKPVSKKRKKTKA